ncbi:MAG: DNA/RNA nuclease SfsA [Oscillospiraceae bacterium]|nr:DNA/RNA nuclease SfsA [Oscillospiraceae bacterium]
MRYSSVCRGEFVNRPNRFIANVIVEGVPVTAHVKNTGRCRELLLSGAEVYLEKVENTQRKTAYDLVAVRKTNGMLINIDSQAPNKMVREWLDQQAFDRIQPEFCYGHSRVDFCMEKGNQRFLLEVKGCTLERDGLGFFPDAPTARGTKHLRELMKAASEGYNAAVAFVIQMDGVSEVRPNAETDPKFAEALKDAEKAGVKVLFLMCHVEPDVIEIVQMNQNMLD